MKTLKIGDVVALTRDQVVPYYVDLIKSTPSKERVIEVNNMILSKWTSSGLNYIKEKAWKIVDPSSLTKIGKL